jgi:hypothetical protein
MSQLRQNVRHKTKDLEDSDRKSLEGEKVYDDDDNDDDDESYEEFSDEENGGDKQEQDEDDDDDIDEEEEEEEEDETELNDMEATSDCDDTKVELSAMESELLSQKLIKEQSERYKGRKLHDYIADKVSNKYLTKHEIETLNEHFKAEKLTPIQIETENENENENENETQKKNSTNDLSISKEPTNEEIEQLMKKCR